jgi:hypothetical protein
VSGFSACGSEHRVSVKDQLTNCQVSGSQVWNFDVVIVSGHSCQFVPATLTSCALC